MTKLNILFVFGFPVGIGGHYKSALAIAKFLILKGHRIFVMAPLGGAELMLQEFKNVGIKVLFFKELLRAGRLPSPSGSREIENFCLENNINIIHAQDFMSISRAFLAAIRLNRAFVYTKAGGPVNDAFPPHSVDSIFYSKELLDGMAKRHRLSKNRISVIPSRIDTTVYKSVEVDSLFLERFNLTAKGKKIVMAIRLHHSKMPWINNLLECAEEIGCNTNDNYRDFHFVIAGEGPLQEELRKRAEDINQRAGYLAVQLIGPLYKVEDLVQFYNYADVVVGNGRGILEAMACGTPAIILGENGEAALLEKNNANIIKEFNFSGRHFRYENTKVENLPNLLRKLFSNKRLMKDLSCFVSEYIKENMSAERGADMVDEVYKKALSRKHTMREYINWWLKVGAWRMRTAVARRLGEFG